MPRIRAGSIQAHKEASRAAILDAAQKVFLANGYATGSLTAIADVAGIPRTTIYEYYPSKGHILLAVLEDRVPPLLQCLLAGLEATDPLETLNEIFTNGIELVVRTPELAELMFRVGRELPKELRDAMWALLDPITNELFRQARAGAAAGDFPSRYPDRFGRILADMLASAIDELTHGGDFKADMEEVLEARLAFIRYGLVGH
jgi:AcrR family transcriptional regulator